MRPLKVRRANAGGPINPFELIHRAGKKDKVSGREARKRLQFTRGEREMARNPAASDFTVSFSFRVQEIVSRTAHPAFLATPKGNVLLVEVTGRSLRQENFA